ncbi:3-isopropylmalate dehydrogenase [Capsulimonas corticalis]|uniref:3-isopropylmalate dehydrogenase n=1 Tax=Capsulimonas corticalis TaxID=2219043 RepID=A0A402CY55_9BACT|nr:3-isopropylmalate dehydrogenase [Capsulimonas corticalis]BDI31453.1 3-isopropylmalate dehydrogenase [Capsulimonas corticalis]
MAKIAVLAGDGIGPEIIAEGLKVLKAVAPQHGQDLEFTEALVGGAAYDATGHPLPPETLELVQNSDAIFFGAVGGPKYDVIPDPNMRPERGALLPLRKKLGLYANLRPCILYSALSSACPLRADLVEGGFDILVVRELTGGLYFGQPKSWEGDNAIDTCLYSREEITRILHVAFKAAQKRPNKRVVSVDKANVLETSRLWRDTATKVAAEYPDVELSHQLVDATAMDLVRRPQSFDVIVTENLFGDILSDEAAQLTGSLGMLPSASLGQGTFGLYEPSHGSAPDIAGTGKANPLATILSAALLLRYSLGAEAAALQIEKAVEIVLNAGHRTGDIAETPDTKIVTCTEMGDLVVAAL